MLSLRSRVDKISLNFFQRALYHVPLHEKSNLLLMGAPGCGKTSIGKLLGSSLNRSVYDFDDDHLEKVVWKQSVSSKLAELGDEEFLNEEGKAAMLITPETHKNTIISLTGSNPLNFDAMNHLRKNGICIYLDCDENEIIKRCHLMKVNRIVGQNTKSLEEILKWRHNIYENSYDLRIIIENDESLESINKRILNILNNEINANKYQLFISTRNGIYDINHINHNNDENIKDNNLSNIILNGLSDDGGLYFPKNFIKSLHKFNNGELQRISALNNYDEIALRVLETFPLDKNLSSSKLKDILSKSYKADLFSNEQDIIPLYKLNDKLFLMELFHGNTASFKDIALNLFPKLFLNACSNENDGDNDDIKNERLFIVATSGDTGSSVLNGFDTENKNIPIIILYPKNGISKIQEMQIAKYGQENSENILILGIKNGDFDFCQNCVKYIFENNNFKTDLLNKYNLKYKLSAANSINWARLLPQIPFYFWGYKQLNNPKQFDLCIPTGNFGHILGAIIAKRMGIPIRKLIVATNSNCVLYDFINNEQGIFDNKNRVLNKTNSPSIDILLPSNLERYLYLISNENEKKDNLVKKLMMDYKENEYFKISENMKEIMDNELVCGKSSDLECLKMIKYIYNKYNVKIDPHTAIAMDVAHSFNNNIFNDNHNKNDDDIPMIIASTAHYSKFPETMLNALNDEKQDIDNINNLEYNQLFDILENKYPSKNCIHPQIEKLVYDENKNDNNHGIELCEPNIDAVIEKIETFLKKREQNKFDSLPV